MSSTGLQRSFSEVEGLHDHPFFKETGLRNDLSAGEVFPAIRKDEVHFYHGGARLCRYDGKHMYTNRRYLGIHEGPSRDDRIKPDWFNPDKYRELKKNCGRRPAEAELSMVSGLFPTFSIAKSDVRSNRARLLDIECRFPGRAKPGETKPKKAQDMIDCLFLTPKGTLVFVEMKRAANKEARSSSKESSAVIKQIRGYEDRFEPERSRTEIRDIYARVIGILSRILVREDLPLPRALFNRVPLLVVGPSSRPSPGSKEVWQREVLATPPSLDAPIIGIDGRDDRMVASLDEFFRTLDGRFAEAASQ